MLRTTQRAPRPTTALLATGLLVLGGLTTACDDDDGTDDVELDVNEDEIQDDIDDGVDDVQDGVDDVEDTIQDGLDDVEDSVDDNG